MPTHARLGASTSEIWLNCPGAPAMWDKAPPKKDSPYALEGTKAHELAEKWLRALRDRPRSGFVIPREYSPEDVKAVKVFVDDVMADFKNAHAPELVIEERVDLSDLVAPEMFGTVDAGIVDEFGTLIVNDYKHGRGVGVEVVKDFASGYRLINTQLVYYALGLAKKYHFNFDEIMIKITQPRFDKGPPIKSVTMHVGELLNYVEFFKEGVKRTKDRFAKRTPGKWCRFCQAKDICKESKMEYRTDVRADFF